MEKTTTVGTRVRPTDIATEHTRFSLFHSIVIIATNRAIENVRVT